MRKWFKTRAEQAMLRTNVKYIIGHSLGLSQIYYRPTEHELLTGYLKAIPYLSINDDNAIDIKSLREEQQILVKKTENKEKEIEDTKKHLEQLTEEQQKMREMIASSMRAMASTTKMFTTSSVEPKEGATIPNEKLDDMIRDTTRMMKAYIKLEGGEKGEGEEKYD